MFLLFTISDSTGHRENSCEAIKIRNTSLPRARGKYLSAPSLTILKLWACHFQKPVFAAVYNLHSFLVLLGTNGKFKATCSCHYQLLVLWDVPGSQVNFHMELRVRILSIIICLPDKSSSYPTTCNQLHAKMRLGSILPFISHFSNCVSVTLVLNLKHVYAGLCSSCHH